MKVSIEVFMTNFIEGRIIEGCFTIWVIILLARRGAACTEFEAASNNYHLGVTWIGLITDAMLIQPHDPIQDPDFVITVTCFAEMALNLQFKHALESLLVLLEAITGSKSREVIPVDDHTE